MLQGQTIFKADTEFNFQGRRHSMAAENLSAKCRSPGTKSEIVVPDDLDAGMNTAAAAKFLGYSLRYVQKMRLLGNGPEYYGRPARYTKRSLIRWQEEQKRRSTSSTV